MKTRVVFRFGNEASPGVLHRVGRTFRPTLKGQSKGLVVAVCLCFASTFFELLRPWPIKFLIDSVLFPAVSDSPGPDLPVSPETAVLLACLLVLISSWAIGSFSLWLTIAIARVGRKVTTRIRRMLFEHLHRLAVPFHQSARSGDLLVRLMGDVNMVRNLLSSIWITVLGRGSLFLGTAVVLFVVDPVVAVIALAPVPFLVFGIKRSSKKLATATKKQRQMEGNLAAFASESLQQIDLVKAYASEERTTRDFSRQVRSSEKAELKAKRIAAGMGRYSEIMTGLGIAVLLFVGSRQVLAGNLSVGDLIVALSYARSLYKPLRKLSRESARLAKSTACAHRLLEILELQPEDDTEGIEPPDFQGEVVFEDVHFSYPNGTRALRGVSFRIPAGSCVQLTGSNGAGKSTVLSLLLRLISPERGSVRVDGEGVEQYRLSSYRKRLAYVPQQIQLFSGSVRDNILYGRPDATENEMRKAACDSSCDEFIQSLPSGYDTLLGEGGCNLSGGQARRLMLARAAVRDARLLVLDEPLAGLDREAREFVACAVKQIAGSRTTIVVHHGKADEMTPDYVIELAEGEVKREVSGGGKASFREKVVR